MDFAPAGNAGRTGGQQVAGKGGLRMDDITVRILGEDEWQVYRQVRLRSLQDAPDAFAATYATEADFPEDLWRERMRRSTRLVAEHGGEVMGVISVTDEVDTFERAAEAFGLWVTASGRGEGVATQLMTSACDVATQHSKRQLVTWVGTDNGRAVAFASSYGFRPTEYRRPMLTLPVRGIDADAPRGRPADTEFVTQAMENGDDLELAMVLALRT